MLDIKVVLVSYECLFITNLNLQGIQNADQFVSKYFQTMTKSTNLLKTAITLLLYVGGCAYYITYIILKRTS